MIQNKTNDDDTDDDFDTDDLFIESEDLDKSFLGPPSLPPPGEGTDPKTMYAYLEIGPTGNLYGNAAKEYSKKQTLTDEQKEIIIGTMLGDATIPRKKDRPGKSIKFEQRINVYPYVYHLYEVFKPLVGTGPRVRYKKDGKYSIWFRTYSHDSILFYHNLFYSQDPSSQQLVKIVPSNIHKFLTPKAVAYWFMDDGTYNYNRNTKNYLFSTQGFKQHEVQTLCDALKFCFDISASVHKDGDKYRLYINAKSSSSLIELIDPYILDTFRYKL